MTVPLPLAGVRVLALEQMQAVPFATQLLARLGADVVKVEPLAGESGRAAQPAMIDGSGRRAGATFLRYGSGKRSIAVDLKDPRGRDLVLGLAERFDVLAENLGPGRADRLGFGYESVSERNPRLVYLSITGFGRDVEGSPYARWPAYASVAEAMCGAYEYARHPHQPPVLNPMGGLGDTGTGLFGVIGVLAALRHREQTGRGQLVDVAMLDAMLSISDVVTNFWSMGLRREPDVETRVPYLLTSFRCRDGWCVLQVSRPHQFERLARLLGRPEWVGDERFADGWGWHDRWPDTIRPAVEDWAAGYGMRDAAGRLADAGLVAAPCYRAEDVVHDPHVAARRMLVEIPRPDGAPDPVLVAGNPVKLSAVPDTGEKRPPYVGEHTAELLGAELGLTADAVAALNAQGIVGLG
ncbi:CaiB/BaiF CoA transferase family protein [Cryptosporangium aurantiacum]|uniref:CoA:oxalate CoA-transferase n=1 Tax=Cryptosporangium aurantiacum TaxID=134849 RepID=A0A1M7RK72_9ACTN|nr:CoA transferase [Cryptosporangium aurantiacum]SHN46546.1 CoA:oxalate CoA-transferase [Cryptosporangium aurantiacum]